MRALRFTKSESTAYTNGERRFWREVQPMPKQREWLKPAMIHASPRPENDYDKPEDADYWQFFYPDETGLIKSPLTCIRCPYGTPGDRVELIYNRHLDVDTCTITTITVEQRDGKWGWVVEVSA